MVDFHPKLMADWMQIPRGTVDNPRELGVYLLTY